MRKSILYGSAAFAFLGLASSTAQAQYAFGAGSAGSAPVYRQLFDCLYGQVPGTYGRPAAYPKANNCAAFNMTGFAGGILYAPTSSSNGKLVLRTNDPNQITRPSLLNEVPYTDGATSRYFPDAASDPAAAWHCDPVPSFHCFYYNPSKIYYDGVQFVGSEEPVNTAETAAWNAAGNPAKFGNIVQVPTGVGAVAVVYNDRPVGGVGLSVREGGLNLSRNALCGIFSGHITKWNNPILTALNGGIIGTGSIKVVHPVEGSGTNFLLTNALAAQCRLESGPNNEVDPSIVSYAFPWTDRTATTCPILPARGSSLQNWPDLATDQCGSPIANPGGGNFVKVDVSQSHPWTKGPDDSVGEAAVMWMIGSTAGAIGFVFAPNSWHLSGCYLSDTGQCLNAANIESQWDITASTGQFQPPTYQGALIAMSSAVPNFPTAAYRANPLAWSLQGVVPNPVVRGSYPISGFTWIEMYQCYQPHLTGNNAFNWLMTGINYLYGSPNAYDIMHEKGFAELPVSWKNAAYTLLTDSTYGPKFTGSGSCAGKVGAY